MVLAELSRQSHLPLSYSSSLVPVARPCRLLAGPARPLGVVLGEVLAAEHLSYGLLNGQLVLWPAHAPLPAGVVAVDGRSTRAGQPVRSPEVVPATPVVPGPTTDETAAGAAKNAAAGSRPASVSIPISQSSRSFSSGSLRQKLLKQDKGAAIRPASPIINSPFSAKRPILSASKSRPVPPLLPDAVSRSRSGISSPVQVSATKRTFPATPIVPKVRSHPAKFFEPATAQNRARPQGPLQGVAVVSRQVAAASVLSTNAIRVPAVRTFRTREGAQEQHNNNGGRTAGRSEVGHTPLGEQRPRPLVLVQVPVSLLTPLFIMPTPELAAGSLPLIIQPSAGQGTVSVRNLATESDKSGPPDAKKPFALTSLLHPSYLHAEAWGSETLPLSAVIKVGIPRIYLVLGVAAGSPGRPPGGPAGGVGLGTVGQSRGRFTPSLDLMQWFVAGDRETPGSQLTQLRPLLAWQIKQSGRLQVISGPTLNLATGFRRDAGRIRGNGELGQGQWLWLDSGDEHTFLRFWPGVQVGLRF